MRSRWLSTFTLLGALLLVLGVVGKVMALTGHHFVYDPGQVPDGNEAWYYLVVGALMVLNGLMSPAIPAEEDRPDSPKVTAGRPAADRRTPARPVVATAADKNSENV